MTATDSYRESSAISDLFALFAGGGLPANASSVALASSQIVASGPGFLVSFTVSNTNAVAQFIQLHPTAKVPANGAVPLCVWTVSGSADKFVSYSLPGRFCSQGAVLCNSSTAATLTIGSADCFFDVQHIPVEFSW